MEVIVLDKLVNTADSDISLRGWRRRFNVVHLILYSMYCKFITYGLVITEHTPVFMDIFKMIYIYFIMCAHMLTCNTQTVLAQNKQTVDSLFRHN